MVIKICSVTVEIVRLLTPESSFSPEEVELRDLIGAHFNEFGLTHLLSPQLMIVNSLFSPGFKDQ